MFKKALALASLCFAASNAYSGIVIEYSEVGSDLFFEFSGSLDLINGGDGGLGVEVDRTLASIGLQSNERSIFYSNPLGQTYLNSGSYTPVSVSSDYIWDVSSDNSGATAFGDTFMFRYNYQAGNDVTFWLDPDYIAGDFLEGGFTAVGYSIASSGVRDWQADLGDYGTIELRQKSIPDDGRVPVPAPLALLGLGLIGIAATKRRKT